MYKKKKILTAHEKNLNEKYEQLYKSVNNANVDQETVDEFQKIKTDLEALEKQRAQGVILRSKSQWVEEGEKNTSYFLQLEKL